METETATPLPSPYRWGEVTRLWLKSAGWNLGRCTVPPHTLRGPFETLVRDRCATWVDQDTIELSDTGWTVFYRLTGYSPDYYSRTHQMGQHMAGGVSA